MLLTLLVAAAASAQPRASDLESRLPALTGVERAHALTELTELLNNDAPRKAIAYGNEALAWYDGHPDPAREVDTLAIIAWGYMILSDYQTAVASAEKGRLLASSTATRAGKPTR